MSRSLDLCEHGTASVHCSQCQHDHYTKTTILETPCANCGKEHASNGETYFTCRTQVEDILYHSTRELEEVKAENERLKERLKVACEYFEKINMQRMSMHLNMGSLATRCLELSGEALEQIGRE